MTRGIPGLRPPLSDRQASEPERLCEGCGGEMYAGENLYLWEDRTMCVDCFKAAVSAWLEEAAEEAAQALGVEKRSL